VKTSRDGSDEQQSNRDCDIFLDRFGRPHLSALVGLTFRGERNRTTGRCLVAMWKSLVVSTITGGGLGGRPANALAEIPDIRINGSTLFIAWHRQCLRGEQ
jgi:hypothetical protein